LLDSLSDALDALDRQKPVSSKETVRMIVREGSPGAEVTLRGICETGRF